MKNLKTKLYDMKQVYHVWYCHFKAVAGELSAKKLINEINLKRDVDDVEHLTEDESCPVQGISLLVVIEILRYGSAVFGPDISALSCQVFTFCLR